MREAHVMVTYRKADGWCWQYNGYGGYIGSMGYGFDTREDAEVSAREQMKEEGLEVPIYGRAKKELNEALNRRGN